MLRLWMQPNYAPSSDRSTFRAREPIAMKLTIPCRCGKIPDDEVKRRRNRVRHNSRSATYKPCGADGFACQRIFPRPVTSMRVWCGAGWQPADRLLIGPFERRPDVACCRAWIGHFRSQKAWVSGLSQISAVLVATNTGTRDTDG